MKYLLTIVLVMAPVFNEIAEINKHKRQAKEAYVSGDYETALSHYIYLVDSLGISEPEVLLNLGNTYYKLQDTTAAMSAYSRLYKNGEKDLQSIANQQNGILLNQSKKPEQALEYFKQALKNDPTNEDARYNYELLKKVLKQQEENQEQENKDNQENQENQQNQDQQQQQNEDQQQQNQDQQQQQQNEDQQQQNQDQQNEEQQESDEESEQKKDDKEGEESDKQDENAEDSKEKENAEKKEEQQKESKDGEQQENEDPQDQEPSSINEKLKDMKISEEKARMILEAMKNNEIQYFQQNKRKPTKKADPSKPDW